MRPRGVKMPPSFGKKISVTKQARIKREKIGAEVIRLLVLGHPRRAKLLAMRRADLFFPEGVV